MFRPQKGLLQLQRGCIWYICLICFVPRTRTVDKIANAQAKATRFDGARLWQQPLMPPESARCLRSPQRAPEMEHLRSHSNRWYNRYCPLSVQFDAYASHRTIRGPGPLAYCPSSERGVVAGGSCSSVAEHWHGKPKALGSIPGSSTFLSSPFSAIPKVYGQ